MPESQNIEYKQSWHDDYMKWVCGFANAIGGIIYIGIDNKGNAYHLADYAKLMEDIPNKIRNSMGIICDVQLEGKQGKRFISIRVNPYTVPVSLRGRFYYRTGSTNMELTGVELNEFLLKKAGKTWDDVIEEGASMKDIDENSILKFIEDSREKGRMPETKSLSVFQILEKLQFTEGKRLKRAAIVMFGKDPNKFYPNVQVKIGRFGKDSTDLKFHEVVEGNVVYMLSEVQSQLNHKFLIRPIDFVGMYRIEKNEYPHDALREMLLNALVHRTYMGVHVQLRVYDDRLSIWNEGGLPLGLSIEELKKEHNSRPRNPKIAKACFMAGYIDTWGRGIEKIFSSCKEAGLPEPEIKEMNGGIEICMRKSSAYSNGLTNDMADRHLLNFRENFGTIEDRIKSGKIYNNQYFRKISGVFLKYLQTQFGINSEKLQESFRKDSGKIQDSFLKYSDKPLPNWFLILIIVSVFPEIIAEDISKIIGVSERTVYKNFNDLQEKKLLERIGGRKEGFWQIIKQ
ncbi:MAG: ATP-binding protein [Bacteroidales bacterium]|nr:ATP-binding protein [Bacteroidales bacterium]